MNAKADTRVATTQLVEQYLAKGGAITRDAKGLGMSHHDWQRQVRGQKVASAAEIDAERQRRMLLAVENKDLDLTLALLQKRHDKAIKFDIENGRLGPNGEIR